MDTIALGWGRVAGVWCKTVNTAQTGGAQTGEASRQQLPNVTEIIRRRKETAVVADRWFDGQRKIRHTR